VNFFISHKYDVTVDLSNDEISNKKKNNLVWCVVEIHVMMVTRVAILCPADLTDSVAVECTEGDICCFASIL